MKAKRKVPEQQSDRSPLQRAIDLFGWPALAKACGNLTPQTIRKWRDAGRLPRSEFSGETEYAALIEDATNGEVTAAELLEWSREGWKSRRVA